MTIADLDHATEPSLRERLRTETRAEHEALDARFEGMFDEADLPRYRVFLAMNLAAHAAIEPVLNASELAARGWRPGARLEALRADCQALGIAEPDRMPPLPDARPALPEALGLAYVLEGSRLGARFMAKAIAAKGDASPRNPVPARYLEASSDPGPFRDLLATMASSGSTREEDDRSVEAAGRTFGYFLDLALRLDGRGDMRA